MKLINVATEQECNFDTPEAAENFLANVEDADNWTEAPAASNVVIKADTLADAEKALGQLDAGKIADSDLPDAGAGDATNESQA